MENVLVILISVLPVYLIGLFVYKKDYNKEPKNLLIKLFGFGILSCLPAALISLITGTIFGNEENMNLITMFFYVFISIALVEEICKWIVVYKTTYYHPSFDELYDAIVYSVFVGLGFACFENILYVTDYGLATGLIRAISAVPGHASDAIIMGNYLGLAKLSSVNNDRKKEKKYLYLSIFIPALLHGIYDYCLFSEHVIFLILFLFLLITIYIYSIKKIKKVSKSRTEIKNKSMYNYCPKCGTSVIGKYCQKCGHFHGNIHIP